MLKFARLIVFFSFFATNSCNLLSSSESSYSGGGQSASPQPASVAPDACAQKLSNPSLAFKLTDDKSGVNSTIQTGALNVGQEVIANLNSSLVSMGMTQNQANIISNGANMSMLAAVGAIAVDTTLSPIEVVAAPIVKGAFFYMNDACAGLTDAASRASGAKNIMAGTIGSLGGKTDDLSSVKVLAIVGSMVGNAVKALPQAGLDGENISQALDAVTSGSIGALTAAHVSAEQIGQAAGTIVSGAVASLAEAGATPEQVGKLAGGVAASAVHNLTSTGLSPEQIFQSGAISQIVSSATSSIAAAGVSSAQSADAIGAIAGAAVGAIADASLGSSDQRKRALADVIDGAMTGAGVLSANNPTLIGDAMAQVSSQAVAALPQAGFSAEDVAGATSVVIQTGISKINDIGVTDPAFAISIASRIIEGTMAGTANLASSGAISAEQTSASAVAAQSGAQSGLGSLINSGVISNASDVNSFTASISSSVSTGLSSGGANASAIANAQNSIAASVVPSSEHSGVSANSTNIVADGSAFATIMVTVNDANGSPMSGKTVSLNSNRGAVDTISSPSGASDANGKVNFTVGSLALGNAIFSATAESVALTQTVQVNFTPGAVDTAQSTILSTATTLIADGVSTATVTVTLQDALGNKVSGKNVSLISSRNATDTITSASSTSDVDGKVLFTVKSTTAGNSTLSAVDTSDSVTLIQTTQIAFIAGPPTAGQSTVSTAFSTVIADGSSNSTITVTLRDSQGNAVADKTVSLVSSRGATDTISASSAVSSSSGLATFTVKSSTSGNANLTASAATGGSGTVVVTQTASISFTAGTPTAAQSTLSASTGTLVADGTTTTTVTVTLRDANGNNASGKTVSLSSSRNSTDTISPASGVSSATGTVVFTVKSSTIGNPVLSATDTTDNVVVAQTASITFTVGTPTAAQSTLSASPTTLAADGTTTTTVTATLRDANGNGVSGKTVSLASSRDGTDTINPASGVSSAGGVVSFTVKSTTSGNATLTATDSTDSVVISQTVALSFSAVIPSASQSKVSASSVSVVANGSTTSTITVTLLTAGNQPVQGKTVTLSSSRGASDNIGSASGTSDASGIVTFLVSSAVAGVSVLTATDATDSLAITQTASIVFTNFGGSFSNTLLSQNKIVINPAVNELNSSWTPQWAHIIGYWKLNGTIGTVAHGATVPATVGTDGTATVNSSTMSFEAGTQQQSARFTGNAWVTTATTASPIANNFSAMAWFKTTATGDQKLICTSANCLIAISSGYLRICIGGCGNTGKRIDDNKWHLAVVVGDGTSMRMHLDGSSTPEFSIAASGTNLGSSYTLAAISGGTRFNGYMDEVAIFDQTLTTAEIATIYSTQVGTRTGTYTSEVADFGSSHSWSTFNWLTSLPFGKELTDQGLSEGVSNYSSIIDATTTPGTSLALMSGIQGLWHLNGAAGDIADTATISDSSGNHMDGTVTNNNGTALAHVGGKLAQGISMDGGNGYISFGTPSFANFGTSDFSIGIWLKTTSTGTGFLLAKRDVCSHANFWQFYINSGKLGFSVDEDGSGTNYADIQGAKVNDGIWHYAVAKRVGAVVSLYIDGNFSVSATASGTANLSNAATLYMGYVPCAGSGLIYLGSLDEAAVWNRALSTAEILELYRRGANRINFQVRSCTASDCSDNPTWLGYDGTNQSYFSELNNSSTFNGTTGASTGNVLPTSPNMSFSNFPLLSVPTNQYFQYKAILESDDNNESCDGTLCSPDLRHASGG